MAKNRILWGVCIALQLTLLTGCSSDSTLSPDINEPANAVDGYSVSLSDALKIADAFMTNIDGGTRASRSVASVEFKTSERTRANTNLPDTLLYLINYEGDNGFALVSADKRLPAIYAISDEGHFEFADTLQNGGLNFFMKTVDNSINFNMDRANVAIGDSTWVTPNWPAGNYYDQFRHYYNIVRPIILPPMDRIGQNNPYNTHCVVSGDTLNAGCAPVAVATLMTAFRWPEAYQGHTIPWDEINSGENNEALAKLIHDLWSPNNLNVQIEDNEPQSSYKRLVPTLENMGFIVPDGIKPFNQDDMLQVLQKGIDSPKRPSPLLVRGDCKFGGHTWVIDGAMWQHGNPTGSPSVSSGLIPPTYNSGIPMCLFHCVWGWDGRQNGFFSFDANVIGGNPYYYGENDPQTTANPYLFTSYLYYIGYIRRNK